MTPTITPGDGPLLLAQPHGGTEIPDEIAARLNSLGLERADTDWHITRLYADLAPDATVISTPVHRYVIDANRDPADASLYPGQNTTGLCPTTTFDGAPIYRDGEEPSADEIAERREMYHRPYHEAIEQQLERIRQRHGFAILYDCHSIRSHIPFLFAGRLPDFNIGSNSGTSCAPALECAVADTCGAADDYSAVTNGRFKGGWTTRRYGDPVSGIHAIQMELAQSTYMQETAPWTYAENKAEALRVILAAVLRNLVAAAG
ncbi:MAG: N-formylglutamate deformylase [Gammaproteobacteria bacterium]|nr:N-formylglutamate deformylase [Gammaproteobacteria bacterium]